MLRWRDLLESNELDARLQILKGLMSPCRLCPRACSADRLSGERGYCGASILPAVVNACAHRGEEPFLSGTHGAGTVFFAGCSLRCCYCQNFQISNNKVVKSFEVTPSKVAEMLLDLQAQGCHNIEFVSPTHFVPQMVEAIILAGREGLKLPVVYNSSGYDSVEVLRLLDGIVDIYLPDFKYGDNANALKFSDAPDYVETCKKAVLEMWRQVGELQLDEKERAIRGLIVRHLVLPNRKSGYRDVLNFISKEVSQRVVVSLMGQYYPSNMANAFSEIASCLTQQEYSDALEVLNACEFETVLTQELRAQECFRPDFDKPKPFD